MKSISEQLAAARQQVFQLEESLRKSELESDKKSKVSFIVGCDAMVQLSFLVADIVSALPAVKSICTVIKSSIAGD